LAKKELKMNKAAVDQTTHLAYARPKTKVTVIVPTYNRARFLKDCLSSVLGQDYEDFQVIILDDASSDEMEEVVQSLADSRLTYVRNQVNLGLFNNWNRAFEFNTSPYLCLLPDDDTLLPGFIRESVQALNEYPQAAMCTSLARYIDVNGQPIGRQDIEGMPRGVISGLDYLHSLVAGLTWTIHPATVLLRSSALSTVGSFEAPHAKQLLDMNLYIRLATHYKIVFINKELAQVRRHSGQTRAQQFQAIEGTETLATIAERIDSVGYLLQSTRAKDASYRNWLAERLHSLNKERGHLSRLLIPSLHLTWAEQKKLEAKLIADVIPPRETLILIDDDMWISESILGRRALPFPERNGQYWGAPTDDNTAIREVERLRRCGATFLVFGSTTFWWFDHYEKFCGYLNSKYNCILGNDHLRVYDIRSKS
jgi:glycosyltransferase involved in cell wall biosynthesis